VDPTVALWILGTIAGGFIAILAIVFVLITFLIPMFKMKHLSRRGSRRSFKTAKELKKLFFGISMGFGFFIASILLVAYCLILMGSINMGSDFSSFPVGFAVGCAIGILIGLYRNLRRFFLEMIEFT